MGHRDCGPEFLIATRPLLVVADLVAGYAAPIVGPASLAVASGEILGLAGPNGSGKTTIFNAIIGTARIFRGHVERQPQTRVSVLRQQPVRLPEMPFSGRELLQLTGAIGRPVPASLRPLLDARLDQLSGGQFQLLQVWAALGAPAGLVLLDEPTNNMDPGAVAALEDLLQSAREARAVLVISHDHQFLRRACTRIVTIGA
jgi:ATPase subunit of ABC transporter with duplicated ATPase domains